MRWSSTVFQSLFVLTLIILAAVAVADAPLSPESETLPAEELILLLEPPVETLCVSTSCINIMVFAHNPETGECREFPNPCSVPEGWQLGCP